MLADLNFLFNPTFCTNFTPYDIAHTTDIKKKQLPNLTAKTTIVLTTAHHQTKMHQIRFSCPEKKWSLHRSTTRVLADKWLYIYLNNNPANNYDWNAKQRANRIVSLHSRRAGALLHRSIQPMIARGECALWWHVPRLIATRASVRRLLLRRIYEGDLSVVTITSISSSHSGSVAFHQQLVTMSVLNGSKGLRYDSPARVKGGEGGCVSLTPLNCVLWGEGKGGGSHDRPIQKRSLSERDDDYNDDDRTDNWWAIIRPEVRVIESPLNVIADLW